MISETWNSRIRIQVSSSTFFCTFFVDVRVAWNTVWCILHIIHNYSHFNIYAYNVHIPIVSKHLVLMMIICIFKGSRKDGWGPFFWCPESMNFEFRQRRICFFLFPSTKHCIGDRLKFGRHPFWCFFAAAPKSGGNMWYFSTFFSGGRRGEVLEIVVLWRIYQSRSQEVAYVKCLINVNIFTGIFYPDSGFLPFCRVRLQIFCLVVRTAELVHQNRDQGVYTMVKLECSLFSCCISVIFCRPNFVLLNFFQVLQPHDEKHIHTSYHKDQFL